MRVLDGETRETIRARWNVFRSTACERTHALRVWRESQGIRDPMLALINPADTGRYLVSEVAVHA